MLLSTELSVCDFQMCQRRQPRTSKEKLSSVAKCDGGERKADGVREGGVEGRYRRCRSLESGNRRTEIAEAIVGERRRRLDAEGVGEPWWFL